MEKLQQLTRYDKIVKDLGIIDKWVFLENLKAISKCNYTYEELVKASEEYIEMEQGIAYEEWYDKLGNIYDVTTGLCFLPLYNIVCDYTNIERQEYYDYEEMKRVVYSLYIEDYNKFIELVKQVITPSGRVKWTRQVPPKKEDMIREIPKEIPKVPIVPKLTNN